MKQNIKEELNYIKYLFGYEKGVVISEQKLFLEQEVKQGAAGDPYQYKKDSGKYFYAKKAEGANAKWIERTDEKGLNAIKTKIFGEQPGTTNQPVTNQPNNTNQPVTNQPNNTNQPVTNQPNNTTNTNNQSVNTNTPDKSNSLVNKSYTFEGKTCVIEKAYKIGRESKSYFILPKKEPSGCRKNSGIYNGREGYLYLALDDSGNSGSLMSSFEYDDGNGWSYEPKYSLATINLK